MKKEEFIRIRVAGWQKKYISLQAEKAHKSLSQYVRDAAMDKDVTVIDGVDDLIRELRRQGNNLNQLVVMARQGHVELVNMEPFMEVYGAVLPAGRCGLPAGLPADRLRPPRADTHTGGCRLRHGGYGGRHLRPLRGRGQRGQRSCP